MGHVILREAGNQPSLWRRLADENDSSKGDVPRVAGHFEIEGSEPEKSPVLRWRRTQSGGDEMTESRMDEVHGRLVRESEESQRRVAGLESELKRIGAAFVETGKKLQNNPSAVALERMTVEKDLAELWLLLPEYAQAVRNREDKKASLEKFRPGDR
jgi:hypothetical protein